VTRGEPVGQAVVVAVQQPWVEPAGDLVAVGEAVVVGVGDQRVRAGLLLVAVAETRRRRCPRFGRATEAGGSAAAGDVRVPRVLALRDLGGVGDPVVFVSADSGSVWLIDVS
jgi:hypothetical protein